MHDVMVFNERSFLSVRNFLEWIEEWKNRLWLSFIRRKKQEKNAYFLLCFKSGRDCVAFAVLLVENFPGRAEVCIIVGSFYINPLSPDFFFIEFMSAKIYY